MNMKKRASKVNVFMCGFIFTHTNSMFFLIALSLNLICSSFLNARKKKNVLTIQSLGMVVYIYIFYWPSSVTLIFFIDS